MSCSFVALVLTAGGGVVRTNALLGLDVEGAGTAPLLWTLISDDIALAFVRLRANCAKSSSSSSSSSSWLLVADAILVAAGFDIGLASLTSVGTGLAEILITSAGKGDPDGELLIISAGKGDPDAIASCFANTLCKLSFNSRP